MSSCILCAVAMSPSVFRAGNKYGGNKRQARCGFGVPHRRSQSMVPIKAKCPHSKKANLREHTKKLVSGLGARVGRRQEPQKVSANPRLKRTQFKVREIEVAPSPGFRSRLNLRTVRNAKGRSIRQRH